jgi:hypothetical protein
MRTPSLPVCTSALPVHTSSLGRTSVLPVRTSSLLVHTSTLVVCPSCLLVLGELWAAEMEDMWMGPVLTQHCSWMPVGSAGWGAGGHVGGAVLTQRC